MTTNWQIPYGSVEDLEKGPIEIFEDYLKDNWSLEHPVVYWKYWDGRHDYTIKVIEDTITVDPLINEWGYFSFKCLAMIHLFGRTIRTADTMPSNLIRVRQHLENLIKSHHDALREDGIYNITLLRTVQGAAPTREETLNASSRHRVFHIIMSVELLFAKRVITE